MKQQNPALVSASVRGIYLAVHILARLRAASAKIVGGNCFVLVQLLLLDVNLQIHATLQEEMLKNISIVRHEVIHASFMVETKAIKSSSVISTICGTF